MRLRFPIALLLTSLLALPAAAQDAAPSLRGIVDQALTRFPGVAAAEAQRAAAAATIDIARQAYRPRLDGLLQINRATHSNVAGLLLPQSIISPISGPVAGANSDGSVWGTAVGALVTWTPFDFGARRGSVNAAHLGDEAARFSLERVKLETAAATVDAYVSALAATATVHAAQAAVDRAAVLTRSVTALVDAGLRPGADAAGARAEQAAAVMQLMQARRAEAAALALLDEYAGGPVRPLAIAAPPPDDTSEGSAPAGHPAIREREAAVQEASAGLTVAQHSADPQVALQGTLYGRGTGVLADNASGSGADGLGLDTSNWAVGVTVTVPIADWANKAAREAVQAARVKAATAERDQAALDLARRREVARQDRAIAGELMRQVPVVISAARDARAQATARYQSGLSSITDVADAERRLAQAEIDAALVNLNAWRAWFAWKAATATSAEDFTAALPATP